MSKYDMGRVPLRARIGLALILAGSMVYGGWQWWMSTRTWVPLDIPISLTRGHIRSPEFKINVDTGYWLYVEVETKPDPDGVACLTGFEFSSCEEIGIRDLKASWSLSNSAKEEAHGSTQIYRGSRGGTITKARGLGEFVVPKGEHYVLDVDFSEDNGRFDAGNPHLIAENYYGGYEEERPLVAFLAIFMGAIGTAFVVWVIAEPMLTRRNEIISLNTPGPLSPLHAGDDDTAKVSASKPSLRIWVGLAMFFVGFATYLGVGYWYRTRIFTPVDIPVSLAAGQIRTGPFKVNVAGDYAVKINWWDIHPRCYGYSLLKTSWQLVRDGKILQRIDRPIEHGYYSDFYATPGVYELSVEILSDASCLDPSHPRLTISTDTGECEFLAAIFEWPAAFFMALGGSLIVLSLDRRREKVLGEVCLNLSPGVGQNFQYAQRLPLRRPFSGLPAFGIFAGVLYGLLAMLMMVFTVGFRITAKGLSVHLLRPGQVVQKSDPWTEPLIVLVKDDGPGQEPKLYLKGKQLSWDALSGALKSELAPRKEWTVYVAGDDCVAYGNVANVVDVARRYRATVFLIDNPSRSGCATSASGSHQR